MPKLTLPLALLWFTLGSPPAQAHAAVARPAVLAGPPGVRGTPRRPTRAAEDSTASSTDAARSRTRAQLDPADDRLFTEADAAPLFTGGELARAGTDLEAGRWEEAARGFATSTVPEARYLRGVALVQAAHGAEALRSLSGLEERLPELTDRLLFWRARALEAAGDAPGAARAFSLVPPTSLLASDARMARARLLARGGDAAGALEALEALAPLLGPSAPDPARADLAEEASSVHPERGEAEPGPMLLAGRLRARVGDAAGARRAFVDCWASRPLGGFADACLAELRRLPGAAGEPPAAVDALRRAEALLDANRNQTALSELGALVVALPAPAPDEPLACRARAALGRAYRRQRQYATAIEVLELVVERCPDPSERARALYVLAGAAAVAAPEEGVERYLQLAREYPEHAYADDALYYAADGLARLGRTDDALAPLAEVVERFPRGDFRAEALFRTAWLEKGAGRLGAAFAALDRLEREYGDDAYERGRSVYWRARLLAERGADGDLAAAREAWRGLVEASPADYYGLLARARLEEVSGLVVPPWPVLAAADAVGLRYAPGPLLRDRHFLAGVKLMRMGVGRAAAAELLAVERKELGVEPVLLLAELLDRTGDHRSAHNLVRTLARTVLRQKPEGAVLRAWRVAYPLAFRAEVERWAPAAGVQPDLLQALMREESGLDPTVISAAGAIGLTQLMPATAQGEARRLGLGRIGQADLMKPPIAVRIGASHLGGLLRRYGGSEVLALAAYNVGDAAVKRWLDARGDLPLDAFVEEIPAQETRGYVKRVMRSYAAYRWLYPAPRQPVLLGQLLPRVAGR